MAREFSRDRQERSRGRPRRDFDDRPRNRGYSRDRRERDFDERPRRSPRRERDFRDSRRGRRDVEKTKVNCSTCGKECEVPFKPKTSKPLYCDDCFAKKDPKNSNKDFEIINEKLDKIMKALKIE